MNPDDKCRRLAEEILSSFRDGFILDTGTRQYIETCLSGICLEEVARRICDKPDLDDASLMDLVFFPNEGLQRRLEPLLERQPFNRDDERAVVALLEAHLVQTTLYDPESRRVVSLRVPSPVFSPFVRRLNISRSIPPGLTRTISAIYSTETATRLKVMLRNTRVSFSIPVADFLTAFMKGTDAGDTEFNACFELMLTVLEEQEIDSDPFHILRLKTDALRKARDAALQFELQLLRSNMETLMQLGIRAPEISAAEADKKIVLLEHIGRAAALGRCTLQANSFT